MAVSVCLLPDETGERAVRGVWRRLEEAGVPTLLSHTHGRHVPHLTLASLVSGDPGGVGTALRDLSSGEPTTLEFGALGVFPRSRCWLLPAAPADLLTRQQAVVDLVVRAGAEVHRGYRAGAWLPHLTLAPRLHLAELPVVARYCFDVLPLRIRFTGAALVDTATATGDVRRLPDLVT